MAETVDPNCSKRARRERNQACGTGFVGPIRALHSRWPGHFAVAVVCVSLLLGSCGTKNLKGSAGAGPTSEAPSSKSQSTEPETVGRPSAGCEEEFTTPSSLPEQVIDVAGDERSYLITTPADQAPDDPAPLIIEFHGFAGSGSSMDELTGMADRGSSEGAVVVHPNGSNGTWQISATGTDAAFIEALLDEIAISHCIDLDRVYLDGFSAGAAFAIIFGCEHEDEIAAIATVAVEYQIGCTLPMSILAFHGTKDMSVPFQDGAEGLSLPGVKVRGTELNMGDWGRLAECDRTPVEEEIGSEVIRSTWQSCAGGTEVILNRIEGGGHTWPGADPKYSGGLTTQQIDATDEIVEFFSRHDLAE